MTDSPGGCFDFVIPDPFVDVANTFVIEDLPLDPMPSLADWPPNSIAYFVDESFDKNRYVISAVGFTPEKYVEYKSARDHYFASDAPNGVPEFDELKTFDIYNGKKSWKTWGMRPGERRSVVKNLHRLARTHSSVELTIVNLCRHGNCPTTDHRMAALMSMMWHLQFPYHGTESYGVFLDNHDETATVSNNMFVRLRYADDSKRRRMTMLGKPRFVDSKDSYGVQAADTLAYFNRKRLSFSAPDMKKLHLIDPGRWDEYKTVSRLLAAAVNASSSPGPHMANYYSHCAGYANEIDMSIKLESRPKAANSSDSQPNYLTMLNQPYTPNSTVPTLAQQRFSINLTDVTINVEDCLKQSASTPNFVAQAMSQFTFDAAKGGAGGGRPSGQAENGSRPAIGQARVPQFNMSENPNASNTQDRVIADDTPDEAPRCRRRNEVNTLSQTVHLATQNKISR